MEATSLANSGKHFDAGWWSVVLQPEEEIAGSFQIEERDCLLPGIQGEFFFWSASVRWKGSIRIPSMERVYCELYCEEEQHVSYLQYPGPEPAMSQWQ